MPKMDMGGLYTGASKSEDVDNQPISGYGTSQSSSDGPGPWRPKTKFGKLVQRVTGIGDPPGPGSGAKHAKHVRQTQHKRTQTATKNIGKCGRK